MVTPSQAQAVIVAARTYSRLENVYERKLELIFSTYGLDAAKKVGLSRYIQSNTDGKNGNDLPLPDFIRDAYLTSPALQADIASLKVASKAKYAAFNGFRSVAKASGATDASIDTALNAIDAGYDAGRAISYYRNETKIALESLSNGAEIRALNPVVDDDQALDRNAFRNARQLLPATGALSVAQATGVYVAAKTFYKLENAWEKSLDAVAERHRLTPAQKNALGKYITYDTDGNSANDAANARPAFLTDAKAAEMAADIAALNKTSAATWRAVRSFESAARATGATEASIQKAWQKIDASADAGSGDIFSGVYQLSSGTAIKALEGVINFDSVERQATRAAANSLPASGPISSAQAKAVFAAAYKANALEKTYELALNQFITKNNLQLNVTQKTQLSNYIETDTDGDRANDAANTRPAFLTDAMTASLAPVKAASLASWAGMREFTRVAEASGASHASALAAHRAMDKADNAGTQVGNSNPIDAAINALSNSANLWAVKDTLDLDAISRQAKLSAQHALPSTGPLSGGRQQNAVWQTADTFSRLQDVYESKVDNFVAKHLLTLSPDDKKKLISYIDKDTDGIRANDAANTRPAFLTPAMDGDLATLRQASRDAWAGLSQFREAAKASGATPESINAAGRAMNKASNAGTLADGVPSAVAEGIDKLSNAAELNQYNNTGLYYDTIQQRAMANSRAIIEPPPPAPVAAPARPRARAPQNPASGAPAPAISAETFTQLQRAIINATSQLNPEHAAAIEAFIGVETPDSRLSHDEITQATGKLAMAKAMPTPDDIEKIKALSQALGINGGIATSGPNGAPPPALPDLLSTNAPGAVTI